MNLALVYRGFYKRGENNGRCAGKKKLFQFRNIYTLETLK